MAKKKATKKTSDRKTAKAGKRIKPAAIEIESSEDSIEFIINKDGTTIGRIEQKVWILHKMILSAQGRSQGNNYFELLAQDLEKEFGLPITERAAYEIAIEVFEKFEDVKKN